jgi:long-chain acyl-CoA synthetase
VYEELRNAWTELTSPGQMFEIATIDVRGAPMRSYAHAPASLRDIWQGTVAHADREYLIYQQERCTYIQAHEFTASISNWLSKQGVQKGDRVAIAMRNYPEWMLAYWAITSMGAVAVGMNAWWVPHEMHYALEDAAPKVLICDKERLLRFEEIRQDFPNIIITAVRLEDEAPAYVTDWVEVINSDPVMPQVKIDPDDDACVFYTSGTTGQPKGAQLTHRGCVTNIMNIGFSTAVQGTAVARASGVAVPEADPNEVLCALVATPLFHVTGNNCVAQSIAVAGGKLVHMYKWDAAEALRVIEAEQVTTFSAVPMMSRELIAHPDFASRDTSSLKSMGGGGAALQPDLTVSFWWIGPQVSVVRLPHLKPNVLMSKAIPWPPVQWASCGFAVPASSRAI